MAFREGPVKGAQLFQSREEARKTVRESMQDVRLILDDKQNAVFDDLQKLRLRDERGKNGGGPKPPAGKPDDEQAAGSGEDFLEFVHAL